MAAEALPLGPCLAHHPGVVFLQVAQGAEPEGFGHVWMTMVPGCAVEGSTACWRFPAKGLGGALGLGADHGDPVEVAKEAVGVEGLQLGDASEWGPLAWLHGCGPGEGDAG